MASSSLPPPLRTALTALLAASGLAFGGCNALLDNRPADERSDVLGSDPGDGVTPGHEAVRDGDASTPTSPDPANSADGAESDAGPLPLQCLVGTKPCGDVCVSVDDPYYGCGGPTCERCAPVHGAAVCVAGQCAVGKCAAGFGDCNANASDGCEADLGKVTSCGACGVACAATPHAPAACVGGACATKCSVGFGDCNASAADGCETPTLTDRLNCGQCGHICLLGKCKAGSCVLEL